MNENPVINTTPYSPSTEVTRVAVAIPWHHEPLLWFATALILFAVFMMVAAYAATRE